MRVLTLLFLCISFIGFSQSPTCNIPLIDATMSNAGFIFLDVQGQPCSRYYYNNNNLSASAAQAAAQSVGANLVSIGSAAENNALRDALAAAGFGNAVVWIGGSFTTAAHGPNDFTWYDGSPITYTNWNPGEPNNNSGGVGPENCMNMIVNSGLWNDLVCNSEPLGLGPSGTSVIKVNLCPQTNATAFPEIVCEGGQATLSASTLFGSTPYNYNWLEISGLNPIGTGASINVNPTEQTSYISISTDTYGCSAADTVTVSTQPCAQTDCDIDLIDATMATAGFVFLNVQGQPCSRYFYNTNTQSASAAQNAAQNVGANLVSIGSAEENQAIQQAMSALGFGNAVVWIGGVFPTAAHGPNDFVWYDGSPNTYTNWNPGEPNNNSGGVGPENCMNMIVSSGLWNDLVCNAQPFGLGPTGTSIIKVNLCPEVSISANPISICEGQTTSLSASTLFGSTPYNYIWTNNTNNSNAGNTANINVSPTENSIFQVVSTDAYGCTATDSVLINVFESSNPTEIDETICQGETFTIGGQSFTESGVYPISISTAIGCDSSVVLTLQVIPTQTSQFSQQICVGNTFEFGGVEYSETGTYTATFDAANGCDSVVTLNLEVITTINVSLNEQICSNETFSFDGNLLNESGEYTATFLSAQGCDSVVTLNLLVNQVPEVIIDGDNVICEGESTNLTATSNVSNSQFLWTPTGATNASITVSPENTTEYSVTAEANNCTSSTITFLVTVNPIPEVQEIPDQSICQGREIVVEVASSVKNSTFIWQPGDLTGSSNVLNPLINTEYQVIAVAEACTSSTPMIFNIVVEECGCEYIIPNVFTPNGDNSNDVFEITTSPTCDFNTFEILIFNRWGKLLWSSSDPTEVWNGNNGNTLCPEGVYFWTMKYSRQEPNKEAENVSENGTITLIR